MDGQVRGDDSTMKVQLFNYTRISWRPIIQALCWGNLLWFHQYWWWHGPWKRTMREVLECHCHQQLREEESSTTRWLQHCRSSALFHNQVASILLIFSIVRILSRRKLWVPFRVFIERGLFQKSLNATFRKLAHESLRFLSCQMIWIWGFLHPLS